MKFARYYKSEWRDRFRAYNLKEVEFASGKCLLDRMPLASGQFQSNSIEQQRETKQTPVATHKLTCKASFDIGLVSFFVVNEKKWIYNDWQKIDDVYIVSLHSKGEYLEKA